MGLAPFVLFGTPENLLDDLVLCSRRWSWQGTSPASSTLMAGDLADLDLGRPASRPKDALEHGRP